MGRLYLRLCTTTQTLNKIKNEKIILHENPAIAPDKQLLDSIWDIFFFWKELEKANLFYEVHPNRRATVEFAKFLLPTVTKFLQDNK